jgi:four helix bundle protein
MDGQDNQLKCLCIELNSRIIDIFESVQKKGEKYLSDRLLRSGTEVGVRVYQACGGLGMTLLGERIESALLYVNEVLYLLRLLLCRKLIDKKEYCETEAICRKIQCMLKTMSGSIRIIR